MTIPRIALTFAAAAALLAAPAPAEDIKVGGIFDLTGVSSDVGRSYAQGVRDAVAWTNEHGGIEGKQIHLVDVDYGYRIPEAVAAYKRLRDDEKVVLINGWGTGDTEALKAQVADDRIPYFSASFSGALADPAKSPYNFFAAPSYSDELRAWLRWVKDDWKNPRPPRVALLYADNPFGRSPLEAARQYCKEIGIELVDEEVLPAVFPDAVSQLLNMKSKGADYAYLNFTTTGVAILLRDAKRLAITTHFGSNPFGFGESLALVAKDAAEGVTGVMPNAAFGESVSGMNALIEFHSKHHPADTHDTLYVRGWTSVVVWVEALRRASRAGAITGERVKNALETLHDFDPGGLATPVTYSPADHRPSTRTRIYVIADGKLKRLGDYDVPRKKEWLGY